MTRDAPAWNDLALFAAVAQAGSLAGAAEGTGLSVTTLSRRMSALEEQLGRRLFEHGAAGYALTEDGAALLDRISPMTGVARDIADWQQAACRTPRVRLSAGGWTSLALAQKLDRWWSADAPFVPEFLHSDQTLDVARREIDIGIRNRRPDQPWLAGRRTRMIHYAAYGAPRLTGWIGVTPARTPSARWLDSTHGDAILTRVNTPRLALDLALAGMGRVVLPTFIGDATPLPRHGTLIADLSHEEWLVAHHETRNHPPIRAALDALASHLSDVAPS